MKKPVGEYTWGNILARLAFGDRLKLAGPLPRHLQAEYDELIAEAYRRSEAWDFSPLSLAYQSARRYRNAQAFEELP